MDTNMTNKRNKRDERSSSILAPIYRKGFYILAIGIAFDLYTRCNYLAQGDGNALGEIRDPIESAVLLIALLFVGVMQARSGVLSDSMRVIEAESFFETGFIQKGIALAGLLSVAAVGGRLYNEVRLFGWDGVTWAGDIAMLVVMLGMFSVMFIVFLYWTWWDYRRKEAKISETD
jgi:hypothetical protein